MALCWHSPPRGAKECNFLARGGARAPCLHHWAGFPVAQCVWVRWWLVRRALPNVALRTPCGGVMGALILVLTWMVGCGDGRAGPCAIAFVPLCTAACCSCPLVSRLRTVSVPRCGIHTGLALYASHNGAGHCFGTFKSYSVLDFMCATTVSLFGRWLVRMFPVLLPLT